MLEAIAAATIITALIGVAYYLGDQRGFARGYCEADSADAAELADQYGSGWSDGWKANMELHETLRAAKNGR